MTVERPELVIDRELKPDDVDEPEDRDIEDKEPELELLPDDMLLLEPDEVDEAEPLEPEPEDDCEALQMANVARTRSVRFEK